MHFVSTRRAALALALTTLAACGGSPQGDETSVPVDTLIKSAKREPMTETDLAGLTVAEISLEIPWTTNKVTRDAAPGAPASLVSAADVTPHGDFDRVVLTFADGYDVSGYEIAFSGADTAVPCGDGAYPLTAERSLVITLRPARAAAEAGVRSGLRETGAPRLRRAGVACDAGDALVWVAEIPKGDQVRVLELRDPARLTVDVR